MESSLRHILHFSNPDVDQQQPDRRSPNLDRVHPPEEHNGRNLTIDELSHTPENEDGATGDTNGTSRKRPNPSSRLAYPRKRAIRACQKCRLRRTKCDNIRPACTACLDLGAECIYSEGDPSTFDTASLAILDKLNVIEDLLRKPTPIPTLQPLSPLRHDSSGNVVQTPASVPSVASATAPEKPIASTRRRMSIEAVLSWSAFNEFTPNLDLKNLLVADDIGRSAAALNSDTLHAHGREEHLLQRFLDHVFIYNPVLEEADLQQYVRDIQFHGLQWDAKSCLLLLIYAHGCLTFSEELQSPVDSTAFRQTAEFRRAESFFDAAQKRMGVLLSRSTLVEAQCFFLAGVYLMATLRPLEAWKMFVQALTCCQAFTPEKISVESREREQRLQESIYWTCFKSELELRLELNVFENSIWDLTYPTFYPSPPDTLKSQREVVWYYYLAEIALRRLGNRILNNFHKYNQSNIDMDAVASFEQQASDWIRSLPPVLNFEVTSPRQHPPSSSHNNTPSSTTHLSLSSPTTIGFGPNVSTNADSLTNSLKFILDGHLLDCYEMMYWPFLTEIILHGSTSTATGQAVETLAYKSLHMCVKRIHKNEHGFFGRHHGTWLMLRSCTRSALVLIAARKDPILARLLPSDWENAVRKVTNMLRFWRRESRDSDDRLRVIERAMLGYERKADRRRSSGLSQVT